MNYTDFAPLNKILMQISIEALRSGFFEFSNELQFLITIYTLSILKSHKLKFVNAIF